MFQRCVPHHNTGAFSSHRVRLPDEEYGKALDCIVKGCSDMLLLSPDGSQLLLGKRRVQPQPDWWFAGGRIFPGETPPESCQRLLRREFGLEVELSRFYVVCCQSLAWGMREQPPAGNGTADIQVVLKLLLTEAEVDKVVLDPQEYAASQVVEPTPPRPPTLCTCNRASFCSI
jgi:8-oxo-dGTP pyrophosphatase MutT (NUDIX family)